MFEHSLLKIARLSIGDVLDNEIVADSARILRVCATRRQVAMPILLRTDDRHVRRGGGEALHPFPQPGKSLLPLTRAQSRSQGGYLAARPQAARPLCLPGECYRLVCVKGCRV